MQPHQLGGLVLDQLSVELCAQVRIVGQMCVVVGMLSQLCINLLFYCRGASYCGGFCARELQHIFRRSILSNRQLFWHIGNLASFVLFKETCTNLSKADFISIVMGNLGVYLLN